MKWEVLPHQWWDFVSVLFSQGLELPRINYAYNGKPYRYIFAAEVQWSPVPTKVWIPASWESLCIQTGFLWTQFKVCESDSSGLKTGKGGCRREVSWDSPEVRVLFLFALREPWLCDTVVGSENKSISRECCLKHPPCLLQQAGVTATRRISFVF